MNWGRKVRNYEECITRPVSHRGSLSILKRKISSSAVAYTVIST